MDIGLDFAIKAMYEGTLDILGSVFGLFWQCMLITPESDITYLCFITENR